MRGLAVLLFVCVLAFLTISFAVPTKAALNDNPEDGKALHIIVAGHNHEARFERLKLAFQVHKSLKEFRTKSHFWVIPSDCKSAGYLRTFKALPAVRVIAQNGIVVYEACGDEVNTITADGYDLCGAAKECRGPWCKRRHQEQESHPDVQPSVQPTQTPTESKPEPEGVNAVLLVGICLAVVVGGLCLYYFHRFVQQNG